MNGLKRTLRGMLYLYAVGLFCLTTSVSGQAITTSQLSGRVLSPENRPVAQASVEVTHLPTNTTASTTTRSDGSFQVRSLRPGGPYNVSARASGYVVTIVRGVYLDIDSGNDVTVRLESDDAITLEAFEITSTLEEALFDTYRTGAGSYLTGDDIDGLPAGDRSINSLARLDPRISLNRDPSDRAISVSGISNRYNSIQVDGVNASDPFGLNSNNTAAERNVIPIESLEALSIDTAPYSSRNSGFTGARINAITKSGTNEFKGSLYHTYRSKKFLGMRFVGEKLDGVERPLPEFSEKTYGVTLGGPILRDQLFFFLAYEKVDEDKIPPSPSFPADSAVVSQIQNALTSLGFQPGSPTPPDSNKLTDDNIIVKVDWNLNPNHRASIRYNNVESSRPTFPGFGSGVGQNNFSFDSHWYDQSIKNRSYMAQLISRWSTRFNTEITYSNSRYRSEPLNNTRQPQVQVRNVSVPGSSSAFVMAGTERSRHANLLIVETDTLELFGSYDINESHTLQAGLQWERSDVFNLFVQDALGRYEFNNVNELLNVAANNDGTVQYRLYAYNQIQPGINPAAEFKEGNLGLFINDVWRVRHNLTLDFGLRMDRAHLPTEIPFNQAFRDAFGKNNNERYNGAKLIQPRFGFNWQPEAERMTVIRGGAGLFYGRTPRVWVSNSYSNTGQNFRNFTAGTSGGGLQAPIVSANPDSQATTASVPPAQQVAFLDSDFELPSRWKANIAFERALGIWDLKFVGEYERTWVESDIHYQNINLDQTATGPDGRALYFNNLGATSSGTRLVNTGFTNRTIQLGRTSQGKTESFMLSLEKPRAPDTLYWRASYVNTRATEAQYGTSSVAASNWNNRSIFNTNAVEVGRSELEIRHRFLVNVGRSYEFISGHRTSFSLLYEGRSGLPYSLVFGSDINGDGLTTNDLLYVPTANDSSVRFATDNDRILFDRIVDRYNLQRGSAVGRASENYPWVHQFDFGIKHSVELPGWRHRLTLGLDILNIGNLIDSSWGLIRGSNSFFRKAEAVANASYDHTTNQYVYSNVRANLADGVAFAPALGRGEPAATRWSALFSARYEF